MGLLRGKGVAKCCSWKYFYFVLVYCDVSWPLASAAAAAMVVRSPHTKVKSSILQREESYLKVQDVLSGITKLPIFFRNIPKIVWCKAFAPLVTPQLAAAGSYCLLLEAICCDGRCVHNTALERSTNYCGRRGVKDSAQYLKSLHQDCVFSGSFRVGTNLAWHIPSDHTKS